MQRGGRAHRRQKKKRFVVSDGIQRSVPRGPRSFSQTLVPENYAAQCYQDVQARANVTARLAPVVLDFACYGPVKYPPEKGRDAQLPKLFSSQPTTSRASRSEFT